MSEEPQIAEMSSVRGWFEKMSTTLSRKSETAIPIRYALSRWNALARYVNDGCVKND